MPSANMSLGFTSDRGGTAGGGGGGGGGGYAMFT